jgi:type I restriction-modification system DNA methylase subunit
MGSLERDKLRIKKTAEVFTPTRSVRDLLNGLDQSIFKDPKKTIIDPACGDGQFLGEAMIKKLEHGINFEQALSTIYGVDLMQDNVDLCRERLLCGQEHLKHIVEKNIVCADALRYHYRFDGTEPYKTANDLQFDQLFG